MSAPAGVGRRDNWTFNDDLRVHQTAEQNLDNAIAETLTSAQRINPAIEDLRCVGSGIIQKSLVKEFNCLEHLNVFLDYRKNGELHSVNIGVIIAGTGTGAAGYVFAKTQKDMATELNAMLFLQLAKGL